MRMVQRLNRYFAGICFLFVAIVAHAWGDTLAVIEGDILLKPQAQYAGGLNALLVLNNSNLWVNGVVPYVLSDALPLANKQAVLDAIEYWQRCTNVNFIELTEDNRNKYRDYVVFVPEHGQLCASFVGRIGGRQEVFLAPRCNFRIALHEIGHLLGLWHEQSRSDRDLYVRIVWENIEERAQYNFDKRTRQSVDYKEYDYQSIMHYSPYAFSKNGKKTIEPLQPGAIIGQQQTLSRADIAAINSIYPGPLG